MTDDLHTRLRSAIEERLALAQAAGVPTLTWRQPDLERHPGRIEGQSGQVVTYDEGFPSETEAAHIAANDPAFVIRACRADLARLERHTPVHPSPEDEDQEVGCSGCGTDRHKWRYRWKDCPEIRSLAEVYEVAI